MKAWYNKKTDQIMVQSKRWLLFEYKRKLIIRKMGSSYFKLKDPWIALGDLE